MWVFCCFIAYGAFSLEFICCFQCFFIANNVIHHISILLLYFQWWWFSYEFVVISLHTMLFHCYVFLWQFSHEILVISLLTMLHVVMCCISRLFPTLGYDCNAFSSLALGCQINILVFKIHFSNKTIIYENLAINIGNFFGRILKLWIFNIICKIGKT